MYVYIQRFSSNFPINTKEKENTIESDLDLYKVIHLLETTSATTITTTTTAI